MNNDWKKLIEFAFQLGFETAAKRLEGVEGVESRAISPGEATTSALLWAIRKAQQEAGRHRLEASLARAERMPRTAATHERFAVTMDKAEAVFRALMEEPDSDAVKPDGVDTTEGIPSANPLGKSCDERSGRRNAEGMGREGYRPDSSKDV